MSDLHQKNTAGLSAQDIPCASDFEQNMNNFADGGEADADEQHGVGEAEMTSEDGEIVEAGGGLSANSGPIWRGAVISAAARVTGQC